jgi:dTDP-4-dehydrorhamnose 3,5-epimerase
MEQIILSKSNTFYDNRGQFTPISLKSENIKWLQSNVSISNHKNTFRGLHYQEGRVLDFVVDLRPDSPDYMTLNTFMLTPDNQIFVPRNFAHGFLTLEDDCVVQYLVDNDYNKESERTLFWNELPELKEILQNTNLIISDKDNPLL